MVTSFDGNNDDISYPASTPRLLSSARIFSIRSVTMAVKLVFDNPSSSKNSRASSYWRRLRHRTDVLTADRSSRCSDKCFSASVMAATEGMKRLSVYGLLHNNLTSSGVEKACILRFRLNPNRKSPAPEKEPGLSLPFAFRRYSPKTSCNSERTCCRDRWMYFMDVPMSLWRHAALIVAADFPASARAVAKPKAM